MTDINKELEKRYNKIPKQKPQPGDKPIELPKTVKKQFEYEKMTLIVKDKLGVKHNFVIDKDTLYVLQNKFEAAGVNFMSFLIEHAEQKPIILKP